MHRQSLLRLLADYRRQRALEVAATDELTEFVQANKDCFERSMPCGHVTGSAWLVSEDGTSVLLTHHKKLDRWLQLGGHADGDSDMLNVALREAEEESGLSDIELARPGIFDIDIHSIPARKSEPEHFHYDVRFAFRAAGDQRFVVSGESNHLAWVPIVGLSKVVSDHSMLRMADKWLR